MNDYQKEFMVKIGINKALFEKRLELNLSKKEAAKLLGVSPFTLTIIERGYVKVSKRDQATFILHYDLPHDFFDDNYQYPIIIDEKLYEPVNTNTLFDKLGKSKKTKIISGIVAFIFAVMCGLGIAYAPKVNGSTPSLFSENVKAVQSYVVNNGKEGIGLPDSSDFACLIPDKTYYIEKSYEVDPIKEYFAINFFLNQSHLPFAWTTGKYSFTYEEVSYSLKYQSRFIGNNSSRTHLLITNTDHLISYNYGAVTCDTSFNQNTGEINYKFISVMKTRQGKGNESISSGTEYELLTGIFKATYSMFNSDIEEVFDENIPLAVTYNTFAREMNEGTTTYFSKMSTAFTLTIVGLIISILSLGVLVLSFLFKNNAEKKIEKFVSALEEQEAIPVTTEPIEKEGKKELKKNSWFNLYVPEFGVRALSLILLFASSIATYVVFNNAVTLNVIGIVDSLGTKALVANLSVLAVMLLYFVKLDIYQNKKSAFATNMFLFILGLLYYGALLIVYYALAGLNDTIETITNALFGLLPGNIVWAVLVFNLIIIFMFAPVKEKNKNKKHAELKARLLTLLPFSYLVASCVISAGLASGWKMPYAVSSLFFYKAPMITVFAIVYCVGVFIYRKRTKRVYGDVNGLIYQNGNKYNLLRNVIAASTIAVIGIFDLLCMIYWPKNPMGFGSNWLMLFAIPFVIFYHPHIGKRNGLWDTIFLILYGLAYVIGIVLIVFAVINTLIKL